MILKKMYVDCYQDLGWMREAGLKRIETGTEEEVKRYARDLLDYWWKMETIRLAMDKGREFLS